MQWNDQSIFRCMQNIGCPISMEKTEWATQLITFLGMLLNGKTLAISVPIEKCNTAIALLSEGITNKKVTMGFIQKLTGTLNFLNKAIVPGHTFTREMYTKLKLRTKNGSLLKQYHHVNLNSSFIQDCQMWLCFLSNQSRTGICRPFMDLSPNNSTIIPFYSDASRNKVLGMGAVLDNRRWLWAQWPENFIEHEQPSIEFLELYALVAAMVSWSQEQILNNCRVTIFCDNESVVHMINNLSSSCPHCLKLIRVLVLQGLTHNRRVFCRHIKSELNILSDALSRLDFKRFWRHAPSTMAGRSDQILKNIWPVDWFWNNKQYLSLFR